MTSIARVQRFVNRTLRGFEEGVFDGLEPVPWKQDKPGVFLAPGHDFLPGPIGHLYGEMIRIEWHPPFDWSPFEELAEALDEDPCGAASLDGALCASFSWLMGEQSVFVTLFSSSAWEVVRYARCLHGSKSIVPAEAARFRICMP